MLFFKILFTALLCVPMGFFGLLMHDDLKKKMRSLKAMQKQQRLQERERQSASSDNRRRMR